MEIVSKYQEWSADYQEDQISILYDSMWDVTRKMARAIAQGTHTEAASTTGKLFNVARSDKNTVITEVFKSMAILLGSSTINRGILPAIAMIMEEIKGLSFKKKRGAAFGFYGWLGESVAILEKLLSEAGLSVIEPGLKALWVPDEAAIFTAVDFGKAVACAI